MLNIQENKEAVESIHSGYPMGKESKHQNEMIKRGEKEKEKR